MKTGHGRKSGNRLAVPGRSWRRWTISNGVCFVAGLLLALATMRATQFFPREPSPATPLPPAPRETAPPAPPWGRLERTPLVLERPSEYYQQDIAPAEVRWVFGGHTPAQLQSLLQSSGLSARHLTQLLDPRGWQTLSNGIVVRPPLDLVRELDEGPRARLYDILARTPDNVPQRFPFVFRGPWDCWFAGCKIRPELLHAVRGMTYRKAEVLCFSDLAWFQLTALSNEVRELVRHLSRVPTMLLTLRVDDPSEVPALLRYWGRAGPGEDFRLLLEAMARVPGGASLNASYFLPPLPRLLLYHYPQPQAGGPPPSLNCVWTAMNFFAPQPDPRFLTDDRFTGEILNTQYQRVPKADAFGDLIVLHETEADGAMRLIHICVHIAEDVVFTKNGGDVFQPWVLMPLADVLALFASEPSIQTAIFRRKG
jgi:hypothetical protein